MRKTLLLFVAIIATSVCAKAQTNLQVFYDFGQDRKFVTTTLEMFKPDNWGNTFFFVDYDFKFKDLDGKNIAPGGTYMEIARCLNFWHGDNVKSNFLKNLNLQVEYNGGFGWFQDNLIDKSYSINHAFLGGLDYSFFWPHKTGFTSLSLKVLYKKFIKIGQDVPMQLTAVWTCSDFFGLVPGLTFSGFADFWWQTTYWNTVFNYSTSVKPEEAAMDTFKTTKCVFLSEPQLWYQVGRWFKCPNLHVGGEVEIGCNFTGNSTKSGWFVNPCLGVKWVF